MPTAVLYRILQTDTRLSIKGKDVWFVVKQSQLQLFIGYNMSRLLLSGPNNDVTKTIIPPREQRLFCIHQKKMSMVDFGSSKSHQGY